MRAPLGPFPPPVNYDQVLPFTPPVARDVFFYRGQFCGIRMPGAPVVPGCNAAHPEVIMACLLDNYPREFQDAYLDRYASYGYTHLQRSIGHALFYGSTLDQYIELTKRAQAKGLYADQWLLGGEALKTPDKDATFWKPILDPILDALFAHKAIDTACVGWQLDQLNQNAPGQPTQSIIDYVADRVGPHDIPLGTHWVNEAGAWWKTGGTPGDRFGWWRAQRNKVLWFHHQGDTSIDIKLYQDKLKDTLDPFGGDTSKADMGRSGLFGDRPFGLTVFECSAQDQFDGKTTEAEGDRRGYLLCCTNGRTHVSGYGNGARRPDGSAL